MVAEVKKIVTHCCSSENAILSQFEPLVRGIDFIPKQHEKLTEETFLKTLMKLSPFLASLAARNPCARSRQNAMNARTDCIQVI